MRLNRRELGTSLLWGRFSAASLVLVAVAAALLFVGVRVGRIQTAISSELTPIAKPLTRTDSATVLANFGQLPLMFEPNRGQTDPAVEFLARGNGYGLFLTSDEAVLSLGKPHARDSVVRMKLSGANPNPLVDGRELLPGKSNYYIGGDPSKWHVGVPQYARVRYSQVYPGIDLVYYGHQGQLEYDFEVAPGADPRRIELSFAGSRRPQLDSGDLKIATDAGAVRLQAPHVYQEIAGRRHDVPARFTLAGNQVRFELEDYDRSRKLIIDPVLTYSTFLGGSGTEFLPSIAVDAAPNIYLTAATSSTDFPVTDSSKYTPGATSNVFVAKLDPTGTTLVFATYLGGSGADTSAGIAADAAGNAYIAGTTTSTDFPTKNPFQAAPVSPGNPHAFVAELSGGASAGTLLYSTYLSGNGTDTTKGMTLDNKGFVYVIGITNSTNFPLAPVAGTFQPTLQGANAFFISKVNPATSGANSLVFSTYFGGGNPTNGTVSGGAIAVDNNANGSNIYFTGGTTYLYTGQNAQTDFPIKNAFQFCLGDPTSTSTTTCATSVTEPDAFVAKLNPGTNTGAQLLYCTYLGGGHTDIGQGIGLDASGNAYVTGSTNSSDHPAVSGSIAPYQASLADMPAGGATDAFVAKVNNPATGTGSTSVVLTYFSYLGGTGNDVGNAVAVDNVQGARVVGTTHAANFPVTATNAVQTTLKGTQDAFVARLDTTAGGTSSASQFVTYLGGSGADTGTGIAIDNNSNTWVTGETQSADFPTVTPFQAALKGPQDIFAARLGPNLNFTVKAPSLGSNSVNAGNQVSYSYQITNNGDTTSNVLFIDNLSGGSGSAPVTFVSASAAGGSCSTTPTDNKVLCNLGTINGGQTASVTVNLTPTGAGTIANSGTIQVGSYAKTGVASPVTVNAFKLTALQSSATVVAGNPATYAIQITPQPVYSASISINCNAGLPGGGTNCKASTTPVTLQNSSPSTITVVISTIARVTTTASARPLRNWFLAAGLPLIGFAFLGGRVRGRGHRLLGGLAVLAIATLILLQPACGGHSSSSTTSGTPAGTYTVNVVATSGQFSQTTPITLVVQ